MNAELVKERQVCGQCGATLEPDENFCRECGAPKRLQYDDEVTLVSSHPTNSSASPIPTPENTDPEKLWWEGFDINEKARVLELEGRYEESKELMERAISLWTQALKLGVQGKSAVACHWFLGNEFYDRAMDLDEQYRLSDEPLGQIPTLSKAVAHLEKAIARDAEVDNFVFGNRENQADLLKLDLVWGSQAMYIKKRYGVEAANSYVTSKIKLIEHLLVVLPNLLFSWGMCYADSGDLKSANTLLRAAANAEDYGDVIDHEDPRYRVAQVAKNNATNNLKYLGFHGGPPKANQPQAEELFEQALAAGDAQEYDRAIELLDQGLCLNPSPITAMVGFFNLFVMIQFKHDFPNRHGDSVPDDEFRWFCRMLLCVKKAIKIYETQLAKTLTGERLKELTTIYHQAKEFEKTNGITYGATYKDSLGNTNWRDFKEVYASNIFPLRCIEEEERQEAIKALGI